MQPRSKENRFFNITVNFLFPDEKVNIFSLTRSIECFHSHGQHLCKFIGTKESVCIRKQVNSQRIVLGHQYGRREVM